MPVGPKPRGRRRRIRVKGRIRETTKAAWEEAGAEPEEREIIRGQNGLDFTR